MMIAIVVTTPVIATNDEVTDGIAFIIENRVGYASISSSFTTATASAIAMGVQAGIGIVRHATGFMRPATHAMHWGATAMGGSGISVRARRI